MIRQRLNEKNIESEEMLLALTEEALENAILIDMINTNTNTNFIETNSEIILNNIKGNLECVAS